MVVVSSLFMLPVVLVFPVLFKKANVPPRSATVAAQRTRRKQAVAARRANMVKAALGINATSAHPGLGKSLSKPNTIIVQPKTPSPEGSPSGFGSGAKGGGGRAEVAYRVENLSSLDVTATAVWRDIDRLQRLTVRLTGVVLAGTTVTTRELSRGLSRALSKHSGPVDLRSR